MKRNIIVVYILIFYCVSVNIISALPITGLPEEMSGWLQSIFDSSLYILIGMFILARSDSLKDYNIDTPSIFLFILFGTIFRPNIGPLTSLSTLFKAGVWGIIGLIIIRIVQRKIPLASPTSRNAIWLSTGLISGVFLAIPLAYLITHFGGYRVESVDLSRYTSLNFIVRSIATEAFSSIPQEFMFRGLLLGYLSTLYDDNKAYLIQGLVFWSFHLGLVFTSPLAFWVHIPLNTLIYSLLAWRSRSLTPSIASHTTYNTFYVIFAILMGSQ